LLTIFFRKKKMLGVFAQRYGHFVACLSIICAVIDGNRVTQNTLGTGKALSASKMKKREAENMLYTSKDLWLH
jgi:hypothetical protein